MTGVYTKHVCASLCGRASMRPNHRSHRGGCHGNRGMSSCSVRSQLSQNPSDRSKLASLFQAIFASLSSFPPPSVTRPLISYPFRDLSKFLPFSLAFAPFLFTPLPLSFPDINRGNKLQPYFQGEYLSMYMCAFIYFIFALMTCIESVVGHPCIGIYNSNYLLLCLTWHTHGPLIHSFTDLAAPHTKAA